jgi:hypothetical protein
MRMLIITNVALLLLVMLGGAKLRRDWREYKRSHTVDGIQPGADTRAIGVPPRTVEPPLTDEWKTAAERDVFSFDRNDVPVAPPARPVATAAVPNRPKPFFFGSMSLGGGRMALMGPGNPGNRAYRPLTVGDEIDGWKLIQVDPKAVVVESGGVQERILMNDPSAQIARDYSKTLSTATNAPVVSIGPPPAAVPAAQPNSQQPSPTGADGPAPRTRIIKTPFGDKVVPEP